jgi:hypothetical protein
MPGKKLSNSRCWFAPSGILIAAMSLSGCSDYLQRQDTVTFSAGEAQAWNRTVHVADPWPPHSGNTRIDGDGQRVSRVIEGYRKGDAGVLSIQAPPPAEKTARESDPEKGQIQ